LQGVQGTQGLQGDQGVQGTQGLQGIQGTQGLQGVQGTQGLQGLQGTIGPVAGSDKQIIFNDNNSAGASANLTFDKTTQVMQVGSAITFYGSLGIVSATSYYGDGSKLSNINASGSVTIYDDTTTNSNWYVGILSVTAGAAQTAYVSSTKLTFNPSTGNLVAGGTLTANSDEILKINVKTIENALDKVLMLRGVEFDRTDSGDHQIGLIAQEIEKIVPDVVYPKKKTENYEVKSVAYSNLVALLIEAIKELNLKIDSK
jgi:hypothetical protein